MEIIPISYEHTYTERSKYNRFNIKQLKELFNQRYLDWDYFYNEAKNRADESSGQWSFTAVDVLTDELQEYDNFILSYYKKCENKGISIEQIYLDFTESNKQLDFLHIKLKK